MLPCGKKVVAEGGVDVHYLSVDYALVLKDLDLDQFTELEDLL